MEKLSCNIDPASAGVTLPPSTTQTKVARNKRASLKTNAAADCLPQVSAGGDAETGRVRVPVPDKEKGSGPNSPPTAVVEVGGEPSIVAPKSKDALVTMFEGARISQDVSRQEIGRRLLETVPVRKPAKDAWFRTHTNIEQYWYRGYVIERSEERRVGKECRL